MGLIVIVSACTNSDPQEDSPAYIDKPFIQDYADKYDFEREAPSSELLKVRADRNNRILVLSTNGLLQQWEKNLLAERQYSYMNDLNIVSIETYKEQFVYLTDNAVFSNSWAGKIYFEHGIENPTHFAFGNKCISL